MSNFQCPHCGMTNIDCGWGNFKTPRELELEEIIKDLHYELAHLKIGDTNIPLLFGKSFEEFESKPYKDGGIKLMNNVNDMVKELMNKDKKTLSYMVVGALHKLEIAKRTLRTMLKDYEFEEEDTKLFRAALQEVEK